MAGAAPPGLSEAEAAARLLEDGPNALPRPRRRGPGLIVLETLREPMFLLLLAAAGLYLLLGDLREGLFLLAGAMAAVALTVLQEARGERALSALRELAQPQARVIRGGEEARIPADRLVRGDILLIGEGDRLPADALLVAGEVLSLDESALTGESAPVAKTPATGADAFGPLTAPGPMDSPFLFAGSLVARGQGVARVARTGPRSAMGAIGRSLAGIVQEPTPLQKAAGRLVGMLGMAALGFSALVALAYGLVHRDWITGALAGITVAIGLIPEEFPMVLAVFMALGAWRLARHRVLVRRGAVIETLGGASVLCVDKTGTLTENRMRVARMWSVQTDAELLGLAALACAVRPVDPMDRAIRQLAPMIKSPPTAVAPERAWPLRPDRMAVVQAWRGPGEMRTAAAKGAPEAIFRLCRLGEAETTRLRAVVEDFAGEGLRVLGVGWRRQEGPLAEEPDETPFVFAGLIGLLDPVRPEVPAAIAEARQAGISVMMITGDHPATALAVARAAGIDTAAGVLLGEEIAALPFPALCERLRQVRVCARVQPDLKLLIVEALKADGLIVAMTGDGVNDAPALEAAHVGIAMGRRGTDVAREAADLVLLDDSFSAIVGGVRLGRRIFANLRRALIYVTAIHLPIAGLALAPLLLGLPPLLYPMHVVLMELAIDPICALAFEGEPSDKAAMKRPPRPADEPLFGPRQLLVALAQGSGVLAVVLGLYAWALTAWPEPQARGAAFLALVAGNLALALADATGGRGRLWSPERLPYWLIAGSIGAAMGLILAVPSLGAVFQAAAPPPTLLALALGGAALAGGWLPMVQRMARRPQRLNSPMA